MREKLSGVRIKCFIDAQVSQYMFDVTACFRIGDGFYEYILIAQMPESFQPFFQDMGAGVV